VALFWGVQCKSCGSVFQIAEIIEPDAKQQPWNDPAHRQQVRCLVCGKWSTYTSNDIETEPLVGPDP
jgi:hypothetical protein